MIKRFIQLRDLNNFINDLINSPNYFNEEHWKNLITIGKMNLLTKYQIDPYDIMNSNSFHSVNNSDWADIHPKLSLARLDAIKRIQNGDNEARSEIWCLNLFLHSCRAIIDYELNNNKKLLHKCQTMWALVFPNLKEEIPKRFI